MEKVKELVKAVKKEELSSAKEILKDIIKSKYTVRKEEVTKLIGS